MAAATHPEGIQILSSVFRLEVAETESSMALLWNDDCQVAMLSVNECFPLIIGIDRRMIPCHRLATSRLVGEGEYVLAGMMGGIPHTLPVLPRWFF